MFWFVFWMNIGHGSITVQDPGQRTRCYAGCYLPVVQAHALPISAGSICRGRR